jgi:ornithine--oxo-acid transaminase
VLFIADEIQTGIARTGRRLACDYEKVHADILILGKALSGGILPISAILADETVMRCFRPGDHGSTFGGNPLACAVATAALEIVADERLAENAERRGGQFRQGVLAFDSPWITQVRGKGLLNAVVFDTEKGPKAGELCLQLKAAGILAKNPRDNIIRFAPPLVIGESEMSEALATMRKVFCPLKC